MHGSTQHVLLAKKLWFPAVIKNAATVYLHTPRDVACVMCVCMWYVLWNTRVPSVCFWTETKHFFVGWQPVNRFIRVWPNERYWCWNSENIRARTCVGQRTRTRAAGTLQQCERTLRSYGVPHLSVLVLAKLEDAPRPAPGLCPSSPKLFFAGSLGLYLSLIHI